MTDPNVSGTGRTSIKPFCRRSFTNSSGDTNASIEVCRYRYAPSCREIARPIRGSRCRRYQRYAWRKPGVRGIANSRIARRPCGFRTRWISPHAAGTSSTLRMPKPIATASTEASATGKRVASPRISAIARWRRRAPTFRLPMARLAEAKSSPTTRAAPGRAPDLRQIVGAYERLLVREQCGHDRDTGQINRSERRHEREPDEAGDGNRVHDARDRQRRGDAESDRDRAQAVRAIELEVLTGVHHVEAADPAANPNGQQPWP